jgi:hypothetical protein
MKMQPTLEDRRRWRSLRAKYGRCEQGLSLDELSERLRVCGVVRGGSEFSVLSRLRDDERRGLVEHVDGRWRLTRKAEAEYSAALSCLQPDCWNARR